MKIRENGKRIWLRFSVVLFCFTENGLRIIPAKKEATLEKFPSLFQFSFRRMFDRNGEKESRIPIGLKKQLFQSVEETLEKYLAKKIGKDRTISKVPQLNELLTVEFEKKIDD